MTVDDARSNEQSFYIDYFFRAGSRNIARDLCNFAVRDGHVHHRVDVIHGIYNMPALQKYVYRRRLLTAHAEAA